jgi:hypothetical protein
MYYEPYVVFVNQIMLDICNVQVASNNIWT